MASGSPSLKMAMTKYHMLTMNVIIVHASRYSCPVQKGAGTSWGYNEPRRTAPHRHVQRQNSSDTVVL